MRYVPDCNDVMRAAEMKEKVNVVNILHRNELWRRQQRLTDSDVMTCQRALQVSVGARRDTATDMRS